MSLKVEWRCATTTCGALCVMMVGTLQMLQWCVDSWGTVENVSCYIYMTVYPTSHQSDLLTIAVALSGAFFGRGTGPILLNNVECTGAESNLLNCSHDGLNQHNCIHSEDASVTCQRKSSSSQV